MKISQLIPVTPLGKTMRIRNELCNCRIASHWKRRESSWCVSVLIAFLCCLQVPICSFAQSNGDFKQPKVQPEPANKTDSSDKKKPNFRINDLQEYFLPPTKTRKYSYVESGKKKCVVYRIYGFEVAESSDCNCDKELKTGIKAPGDARGVLNQYFRVTIPIIKTDGTNPDPAKPDPGKQGIGQDRLRQPFSTSDFCFFGIKGNGDKKRITITAISLEKDNNNDVIALYISPVKMLYNYHYWVDFPGQDPNQTIDREQLLYVPYSKIVEISNVKATNATLLNNKKEDVFQTNFAVNYLPVPLAMLGVVARDSNTSLIARGTISTQSLDPKGHFQLAFLHDTSMDKRTATISTDDNGRPLVKPIQVHLINAQYNQLGATASQSLRTYVLDYRVGIRWSGELPKNNLPQPYADINTGNRFELGIFAARPLAIDPLVKTASFVGSPAISAVNRIEYAAALKAGAQYLYQTKSTARPDFTFTLAVNSYYFPFNGVRGGDTLHKLENYFKASASIPGTKRKLGISYEVGFDNDAYAIYKGAWSFSYSNAF
jgi:hypothetical protein